MSAACKSFARAAQCSAVVPSASAAFTSTRCWSNVRIASLSAALTASINRTGTAPAASVLITKSNAIHQPARSEERRVGKEDSHREAADPYEKNLAEQVHGHNVAECASERERLTIGPVGRPL